MSVVWIEEIVYGRKFYKCSNCKVGSLYDKWGNQFQSKYCPNCGTKMKLKEDTYFSHNPKENIYTKSEKKIRSDKHCGTCKFGGRPIYDYPCCNCYVVDHNYELKYKEK